MRTLRRGRILCCQQRIDMTCVDTGYAMDCLGEIIPRNHALITKMIDSRFGITLQQGKYSPGQIKRIGRRTHLVTDNAQSGSFLPQAKHCLYEVIAVRRIKPSCTHDDSPMASPHHALFAFKFGSTICRARIGHHFFPIRHTSAPIENVIGRDLYHSATTTLHGLRQIFRCQGIQFPRQFLVFLGLINGCISGTINNRVYFLGFDQCFYGLLVADIKFLDIREDIMMGGIKRGEVLHLTT